MVFPFFKLFLGEETQCLVLVPSPSSGNGSRGGGDAGTGAALGTPGFGSGNTGWKDRNPQSHQSPASAERADPMAAVYRTLPVLPGFPKGCATRPVPRAASPEFPHGKGMGPVSNSHLLQWEAQGWECQCPLLQDLPGRMGWGRTRSISSHLLGRSEERMRQGLGTT